MNLQERAKSLGLLGVVQNWSAVCEQPWLENIIVWEETARQERSLQSRIEAAKLPRFKSMTDFDWQWPTKIDRDAVEDLFSLRWINDGTNVVVVGPNGVGKTMIVQNLVYQTLLSGHTARFISASDLLNDLAQRANDNTLQRRLRTYTRFELLCIDEVGYLSYDNRHADLLFEIVTRRYGESKSTVITTNKPFAEWNTVFPNAASVVTLVDRLVHRAEIIGVHGKSYRAKESQERIAARAKLRAGKKS